MPRSGDQDAYLALCSPLLFRMLGSDFLAMEGASLSVRDPVMLQARTKMRAQHAAAALVGSRQHSSIKCVEDLPLCSTMFNIITLQVQDPLTLLSVSQPESQPESRIPETSHSAIGSQVQDQGSIPPVADPKSYIFLPNPCVNLPVH
jgi:hypothetical protein